MEQNSNRFARGKNNAPMLFAFIHILGMENTEMVFVKSQNRTLRCAAKLQLLGIAFGNQVRLER